MQLRQASAVKAASLRKWPHCTIAMAVLSTLRHHHHAQTQSIPLQMQCRSRPAFVEVHFNVANPDIPAWMSKIPSDTNVVKCKSKYAVTFIGQHWAATSEEMNMYPSSIFVAAGPREKCGIPVSCYCTTRRRQLAPFVLSNLHQVINDEQPQVKHDDLRAVVKQIHDASKTKFAQNVANLTPKQTDLTGNQVNKECICCLEHAPVFRWNGCMHTTDGPALLCLFCRNAVLLAHGVRRGTNRKHTCQTRCMLCRTWGSLKKWTRSAV